jgi:hypothetical protein
VRIPIIAKNPFDQRLGLIGVLLVLLCSAALAVWSGNAMRYVDEFDYNQLATMLVHKHKFVNWNGKLTLFRPPGYAFILAAVYQVWDSPFAAKLLNSFALAATACLMMPLSRRLFPSASALAPILLLCYPVFLYAASTLYPQTIGGLLLVASILLLSGPELRLAHLVFAGVIYGFLCLAIPSFVYITPFLFGYLIFGRREPFKWSLARATVLGTVIVLTIAPWTIRNGIEFHSFVPISANGGTNLVLGNSPATGGNTKPTLKQACGQVPFMPDEVKFDRALSRCAIDWITHNPAAAGRLYLAKLANYFNFENELTTATEIRPWQDWVVFATYYPLLILALLRLAMLRRYPTCGLEMLLYAIYFGNGVLTAVFFTRLRFRIPFDLLLVAIDVAFLARLLSARNALRSTIMSKARSLGQS